MNNIASLLGIGLTLTAGTTGVAATVNSVNTKDCKLPTEIVEQYQEEADSEGLTLKEYMSANKDEIKTEMDAKLTVLAEEAGLSLDEYKESINIERHMNGTGKANNMTQEEREARLETLASEAGVTVEEYKETMHTQRQTNGESKGFGVHANLNKSE